MSRKRKRAISPKQIIVANAPEAIASGGDQSIALALGEKGHACAGIDGITFAGVFGNAHSGNYGVAIGDDGATATSGVDGYAISYCGKEIGPENKVNASASTGGVAITRQGGWAVAGDHGLALAQRTGMAQAEGLGSVAVAFDGGFVCGVSGSVLVAAVASGPSAGCPISVGIVGQGGLKPDSWYKADGKGGFTEVTNPSRKR